MFSKGSRILLLAKVEWQRLYLLSYLKQPKEKGKKKMDEIYETMVVKSLDIRQQRTVILVVKETNDCPSLLLWGGFPGGSAVKNPPVMQETRVRSLDREDPLEKELATHFSIPACEIPWTEEPGGLQSLGLKESDTTERLNKTLLWKLSDQSTRKGTQA